MRTVFGLFVVVYWVFGGITGGGKLQRADYSSAPVPNSFWGIYEFSQIYRNKSSTNQSGMDAVSSNKTQKVSQLCMKPPPTTQTRKACYDDACPLIRGRHFLLAGAARLVVTFIFLLFLLFSVFATLTNVSTHMHSLHHQAF